MQRGTAVVVKASKGRKSTEFSANVTASLALVPFVPSPPVSPPSGILYSIFSYTRQFAEQIYRFNPSNSTTYLLSFFSKRTVPLLTHQSAPAATPIIDDEEMKKIEAVKHLIKEHAERRVDLFFYLLVAVYNKQVIIEKAKTIQQNGKGSAENNTQACHSSLFPNVTLRSTHVTPSIWKQIWQSISRQLAVPSDYPSLTGTYFMEALNSTVELPKLVNDFDGKLEGRAEQSTFINGCLIILNKAAKGEMDPRQGMIDFFKLMEIFFNHYERKKKNVGAMRLIWEYQKEGTFKAANKDMSVRDDYLYMMLRINAGELRKVKILSLVSYAALQPHYRKIQDEIYGTPKPSGRKNS